MITVGEYTFRLPMPEGAPARYLTVTVDRDVVTVSEGDKFEAESLEARAEKAERALLVTWYAPEHWCRVCDGPQVAIGTPVPHAEDCIVPGIMERYAE